MVDEDPPGGVRPSEQACGRQRRGALRGNAV